MDAEIIPVGIAQAAVAGPPQSLAAYALGSCVAICLYDARQRIAGMAHVLLPASGKAKSCENPFKFADSGLAALVERMERGGAMRGRLQAKLAGGAEMFGTLYAKGEGIGKKNSDAALAELLRLNIPVVAMDIGADYGRTIFFSAETGLLKVKAARHGERII